MALPPESHSSFINSDKAFSNSLSLDNDPLRRQHSLHYSLSKGLVVLCYFSNFVIKVFISNVRVALSEAEVVVPM